MAMKLLVASGWDGLEVSEKLETLRPSLSEETAWTRELRESAQSIASMMQGPPLPESDEARGQIVPGLPFDLPPPMVSKPF